MEIGKQIIEIALEKGATVAGIANRDALQTSASHLIYPRLGGYEGAGMVNDENVLSMHSLFDWPKSFRSVLIVGLAHPEHQPELDWWDGKGTPGNRRLIKIFDLTRQQIQSRLNIHTHKLHYFIEKGGIFLKDAAVLAGLGVIGLNNMLVTPAFGPRIRLRAIFLATEAEPVHVEPFFPCATCNRPCRSACPEQVMGKRVSIFDTIRAGIDLPAKDGSFNRELCKIRMEKDEAESTELSIAEPIPVKYCRRCEFACPVGRKTGPQTIG